MKQRIRFFLPCVVCAFFILISARSLYAQTGISPDLIGVSFSLSPSYTQLLIQPGKSPALTYTLINQGDPSTFSFHIYRISQKDQQILSKDRIPSFTDTNQKDNPIQFTARDGESLDQSFFLSSKKKKTMRLIITAAENTPHTDYYYAVTAYNEPAGRVSDGSLIAQIKAGAASALFITVSQNGAIDADPAINSFTLTGSSYPTFNTISVFDSFDRIRPLISVKNNGRNFISADGQLTLKNMFGLSSSLPLTSSLILSQSSRTIPLARTHLQTLLPGSYTTTVRIIIHNPHTKETMATVRASYRFFIIPGKLLAIFGFLIVTALCWRIFKKTKRQ